jgi:flagellin-like protein
MMKRGISAIVATVLIILITVAAVTLLWATVIPMIREGTSIQDPSIRFEIVTLGGYTFYDSNSGMLYIQVKRGADTANVVGLEVIIATEGDSILKEYSSEMVPEPNQAKTLIISLGVGSPLPDKITVVPIINNEGSIERGATSILTKVPLGEETTPGVPTPTKNPLCSTAAQCDDGGSCTIDSCVWESCMHTAITSCNMTSDGCCPGSCNPSNDADCEGCANDDECHADSYECSGLNRMLNDNYCNISSEYVCRANQTLATNCDDGNECTIDSCGGGSCSNVAVADGIVCDEGSGVCASGRCGSLSCRGSCGMGGNCSLECASELTQSNVSFYANSEDTFSQRNLMCLFSNTNLGNITCNMSVLSNINFSDSRLTNYWRFDRPGRLDDSKSGQTLSYVGGLATDNHQKILDDFYLDGNNDYFKRAGVFDKLIGNNSFTFSVWAKSTGPGRFSGQAYIFCEGSTATSQNNYDSDHMDMQTSNSGVSSSIRKGGVWCCSVNDNDRVVFTAPGIWDKWYHLVSVYDGATMKLYVDGQLASSSMCTCGSSLTFDDRGIIIGARSTNAAQIEFKGYIDECSVWADDLSGPEISNLYKNAQGKYWKVTDVNATSSQEKNGAF